MRAIFSDITDPRLLVLKGALFVVLGVLATGMLIVGIALRDLGEGTPPWWSLAVLHCVAVWAWCRAYYFAFYVIERYIDAGARYAGLWEAIVRAGRLLRGR